MNENHKKWIPVFVFCLASIDSLNCYRDIEVEVDSDPDTEAFYEWHTFHGGGLYQTSDAISLDGSGNIVVAGYSSEPWNGTNGETPLNNHSGYQDIFVLKLDPEGLYQWHTFYGGDDRDRLSSLNMDESGSIIVSGSSDKTWTGPAGESPLHLGSNVGEVFVLKLDPEGQYNWHTFYGCDKAGSHIGASQIDGLGNIFVTGYSLPSWNGPNGESPLNEFSKWDDIFVLKLSKEGAYQWHTFYGGNGGDIGYSISVSDGNVFVAGESGDTWQGPSGESPLNDFSGSVDVFTLKLDSDGAYSWHTFHGSTDFDRIGNLVSDSSGSIFISGTSSDFWQGPNGEEPLNDTDPGSVYLYNNDIFVIKLDSEGFYEWHTFYGCLHGDEMGALTLDEHDNIFVAGSSHDPWYGPSDQNALNDHFGEEGDDDDADAFVLKLSPKGKYRWHTFYGGASEDFGEALLVDSNGRIFVAGHSGSNWSGDGGEPPLNGYTGINDSFVLKLRD